MLFPGSVLSALVRAHRFLTLGRAEARPHAILARQKFEISPELNPGIFGAVTCGRVKRHTMRWGFGCAQRVRHNEPGDAAQPAVHRKTPHTAKGTPRSFATTRCARMENTFCIFPFQIHLCRLNFLNANFVTDEKGETLDPGRVHRQ